MAKDDPSTRSTDSAAMLRKTRKIDDILGGADAMRKNGRAYLPKFETESDASYDNRVRLSPFANLYRDVVDNLADRPHRKPVKIADKTASKAILDIADDIDGEGNSLHVLSQEVFYAGINYGVDYMLVDRTQVPGANPTIADEKRHGARPFVRRIASRDILDSRTDTIKGKEKFTHVRIARTELRHDGYDEVTAEQVLILDRKKTAAGEYAPATWQLLEKDTKRGGSPKEQWKQVGAGSFGIDDIPLVAFMAGRRKGRSFQFDLPMEDAAHLQIEHFQAESNLKSIKTLTCFPMLAAKGVHPPKDNKPIVYGPGAVMFAAPDGEGKSGDFAFIEPQATSLKMVADDIERLERQLRELGRQPLTANSGNLTVVTTAFAAAKGNSAVESWALALKDALQQALAYVALWMRDPSKPQVQINVDLSIDHGGKDFDAILAMRKNGDVSQGTLWAEAKRRSILSPDHDPEAEKEALAEENPDPDSEEDIEAAMTPLRLANAN